MATRDIVEFQVSAGLEWDKLEKMVTELLGRDDLPSIRKFGGRADNGIDAFQESYYDDAKPEGTLIQITADQNQWTKYIDTIKKLSKNGVKYKILILVYRQPVPSSIKLKIKADASSRGIVVDIRDFDYLVSHLSKEKEIFARYFTDFKTQVSVLLGKDDPLFTSNSRQKHAVLASIGAYVSNAKARLARQTLFEKIVLAALVENGKEISVADLLDKLRIFAPGEIVDEQRLLPAIDSLTKSNHCKIEGNIIRPTDFALAEIGKILVQTRNGFESIVSYVVSHCKSLYKISHAEEGFLERNVRNSLLNIFRTLGPLDGAGLETVKLDANLSKDVLTTMSIDLRYDIAKSATIGLASYFEDKENIETISTFVRTYSAVAIQNIDPVGRRWQQAALTRSVLALDTDVILAVIIEELPEHSLVLSSIAAIAEAGVKIVITSHILDETIGHISRAYRTYNRFSLSLSRMSSAMVDSQVWHAIVRGFYYQRKTNPSEDFRNYWNKYYDRANPTDYVKHLLRNRLKNIKVEALDEVPNEWQHDREVISKSLLEMKEHIRPKAEFRDENDMILRISRDVQMAMHLSNYSNENEGKSNGYLISSDKAFLKMEKMPEWGGKPKVLILLQALPEFSSFICGLNLSDGEAVRYLFDPVISSAATLMKDEILELTKIGVNLREVHLDRLEWDLKGKLHSTLNDFVLSKDSSNEAQKVDTFLEFANAVNESGLEMDPEIGSVIREFKGTKEKLTEETQKREQLEKSLVELAQKAAGGSKKAKRRVNQYLREIGILNINNQSMSDN